MDEYDEQEAIEAFNRDLIIELYEHLPPSATIEQMQDAQCRCMTVFAEVQAQCRGE